MPKFWYILVKKESSLGPKRAPVIPPELEERPGTKDFAFSRILGGAGALPTGLTLETAFLRVSITPPPVVDEPEKGSHEEDLLPELNKFVIAEAMTATAGKAMS